MTAPGSPSGAAAAYAPQREATFRGVPMAGVRAAMRSVWSAHGLASWPTGDLLALAQRWFAHTGPGWVLRELSRAAPDAVAGFVEAHPHMSAEARRMATARLRAGPYRRR